MKILVVDDNSDDRRLLRLIVERHGHEALEAEDGLEGLRMAKLRHPDLIISDALMPLMDGFHFLKAVKEDELLRGVPFVFYSAIYKADRDQALASALGADAYILKPKDPGELWREVDAILRRPRPEGGAVADLAEADEEYLRRYSQVVAANLEEKVRELEETLALRLKAEAEVRQLNAELERRVVERTRQLQAANNELEAFSYSVSHDLRAPLRAIEGFAGMVVEDYGGCLDEEGRRLLGVVRANTLKMGRLIDDLLTFSRTGRSEMKPARVAMGDLARSAFEEVVGDPGARARIDLTVGELPAAVGDAALLRQVWVNLLSNAVKYSAKKERAVIGVSGALEENRVVYRVRDNGAGFDMQYAGKLFGVFQRLHTAQEFEGTGIGLALVQRIVARHGGRVWAEGAVGQGATFSFALPVEEAAEHGPGTAVARGCKVP